MLRFKVETNGSFQIFAIWQLIETDSVFFQLDISIILLLCINFKAFSFKLPKHLCQMDEKCLFEATKLVLKEVADFEAMKAVNVLLAKSSCSLKA